MTRRSYPISIVHFAGMLAVFAGERVLGADTSRVVVTAAGLALVVAAAGVRAWRLGRAAGERRSVERMLLALQLAALGAVLVYFAQSDVPARLFGQPLEHNFPRLRVALSALWPALWLAAAAPTVLVELAYAAVARAPRLELRRIRGAMYAGLGLAGALVFAFSAAYVASERDVKVDLSYFRTARPGEATRRAVRGLTEPVRVSLFFPPANEVADRVAAYFDDLRGESPKLEVARYDQAVDVAQAKELGVTGNGIVVLARGGRREQLALGLTLEGARTQLASLDREAQKRLLQVARSGRIAYLTTGHGERTPSPAGETDRRAGVRGLRDALEDQGYQVRTLGVAEGLASEVPKDAAVVLAIGPTRPFLAEETAALGRYLDGGGKLFAALDPDAAGGKELAGLVGLELSPATLANDSVYARMTGARGDRANLVTNLYSSHPSVSTLGRLHAPVVLAGAGALTAKPGAPGIDFTVRTHPQTWDDKDGDFELDAPAETRATRNVAAAVQKGTGRAIVLGDSDALTDALFEHPQLGNALLLVDGVKWLVGDESIIGELSSETDAPIVHTRKQDVAWFYATIFLAPVLVLGLGWVATRRGRRAA